jgi:hypothetical protein
VAGLGTFEWFKAVLASLAVTAVTVRLVPGEVRRMELTALMRF